MSVKVLIPTVLRKYTDGQEVVQAEGNNLREVIQFITARNEQLQGMIFKSNGEFNFFVANLFVNEEDARFLQKLDTPVKDGDEVSIIAAAAGGRDVTENATIVAVILPPPLRKFFNGQTQVQSKGSTLREALLHLARQNSDFKIRLFDEESKLLKFVNFYVNEEDVRDLQKLDTPLKSGDEIIIVPVAVGG